MTRILTLLALMVLAMPVWADAQSSNMRPQWMLQVYSFNHPFFAQKVQLENLYYFEDEKQCFEYADDLTKEKYKSREYEVICQQVMVHR